MSASHRLVIVLVVAAAASGCDQYLKEWKEEREAKRQEEAEKKRPDYIPPPCRYAHGLYRVYSSVTYNNPVCARRFGFYSNQVAWWGGTSTYGPGHQATRVRKFGCTFEHSEQGFVGKESRDTSSGDVRPAEKGRLMITYEGTWTTAAPPGWQGYCQATGWEQFVKEP